MDLLSFIAEVIKALAWPATILILVFLAKPYLWRIPEFIHSAKYKDFEVTFKERLRSLETDVESAGIKVSDELPPEYRDLFDQNRDRLHLIVIEAWRNIERLIRDKFPWAGVSGRTGRGNPPISAMLRELYAKEIFSEEEFSLLRELQNARNWAAHGRTLSLREDDVRKYLKFTAALSERIRDFPNDANY